MRAFDARSVVLVAASARGRMAAGGGARRAVGRAFLLRVGRAARRRQWLLQHGELPVHAVLQRVALNDGQDAVLLRAEFQLQRIRHHQLHWHRLRRRQPHAHHLAHDAHHLLTCLLSRRQCAAAMCCSLLVLLGTFRYAVNRFRARGARGRRLRRRDQHTDALIWANTAREGRLTHRPLVCRDGHSCCGGEVRRYCNGVLASAG